MRTHYLQNSTTPCTSDVFVLTFKPIVSNTSIGFSPTTIAGEVLATSQSRKHLASVLLLGVVMKQTAKPLTLVWSDPIITTYYIRPYYSGEGQTKFLQHTTVRLFLAAAFRHFSVFSKNYQLWKRCPHAIQTQWRVRNPPPLWVQFLKYDTWILSLCLGMALLKEQLFCTVVLNVNEDIKVTYKHPDRQPDMSQSVSMLQKGHTGHHSLQALFTESQRALEGHVLLFVSWVFAFGAVGAVGGWDRVDWGALLTGGMGRMRRVGEAGSRLASIVVKLHQAEYQVWGHHLKRIWWIGYDKPRVNLSPVDFSKVISFYYDLDDCESAQTSRKQS